MTAATSPRSDGVRQRRRAGLLRTWGSAFLLFFLAISAITMTCPPHPNTGCLEILAKNKGSELQMFFNINGEFSEEDSERGYYVRSDSWQTLCLRIPPGRAERVRIDPMAGAGEVWIKSLTVGYRPGVIFGPMLVFRVWSAEEFFERFRDYRPVDVYELEDGAVKVRSGGGDPRLANREDEGFIREWNARGRPRLRDAIFVGGVQALLLSCAVALVYVLVVGPWIRRFFVGFQSPTLWRRFVATVTVLAVAGTGILLFPELTDPGGGLPLGWKYLVKPGIIPAAVALLDTPGAGMDVLPWKAQVLIEFLRREKITEYRSSAGIDADVELKARLVEGAYPVCFHPGASVLLLLEQEPTPAGCTVLRQDQGVKIARCR